MGATIAGPTSIGGNGRFSGQPLVRWAGEHPLLACWGVSVLLAIISGIVWPTIPSYDPFSWVVWGHAVFSSHVPFNIGNGPSWKPLPFFFTAIYGRFGSAAPWLWVVTARTGGVAGLLGAARLCFMLCRRAGLPAWAPWVAALAAVAGIVLSWSESLWTYYFFRGTSEVFLIGVWLWAVERLFCRRHGQAYTLLALEGWMRPEAWPFLFVYGVYLFWHHPNLRIWVVLGLISQPAAWFGPPWISNGAPFLAADHASEYNGDLGASAFRTVVSRGESLQPLPSLGLAVLASFIGLWQGRTLLTELTRLWRRPAAALQRLTAETSVVPLVLTLASLSAAWWVVVIVETEDHYPGLQRFYLPAAAMICVLSGYGVVQIATWVGRRVPGRASLASLTGLLVAAIMCVGSWHWLSERWSWADEQEPLAAAANARIYELGRAIIAAGGIKKILPCASSVVTLNHSLQTAMAWELGTDLQRVRTFFPQGVSGLAFVGPHDSIDGGPPPILYDFSTRTITSAGAWSVQQVYPRGSLPGRCVGS